MQEHGVNDALHNPHHPPSHVDVTPRARIDEATGMTSGTRCCDRSETYFRQVQTSDGQLDGDVV